MESRQSLFEISNSPLPCTLGRNPLRFTASLLAAVLAGDRLGLAASFLAFPVGRTW
jgi:hypothetical protein